MKLFRLHKKQQLPISLEEAWAFFSTPKNLNEITPPDMSFNILSGADEPTYTGQIIRYKIAPVAGIPMNWVTEITYCEPGHYFIDEQRFGPYSFWHHQHRFTPNDKGVMMEDILHYGLPMGWLGRLVAGSFVRNKVEHIFEYRFKKLENIFGQSPALTQV